MPVTPRLISTAITAALALPVGAEILRPGWESTETALSYTELVTRVKDAARAEGMGVVTEAGPTEAARARGIDIPGNRVIGIFNNDFAVRILTLSTAAMIEAPVRMYVTETPDGALLSYKTPSSVFAPYADEGGPELEEAAGELDAIFARIAARAIGD